MDDLIDHNALRRAAAEKKLGLDLIEKDYLLGWILKGISSCSISDKLVFKGGTALSKIYYPGDWRISEDLDFTVLDNSKIDDLFSILREELPSIVEDESGGIGLDFKGPLIHEDFLRVSIGFMGPITRHRTKIEVTKEKVLGDYRMIRMPIEYDYPDFSLLVYTLDNILAEKLRSLIERTKIRDYYDVWKLLGMNLVDKELLRKRFYEKCRGKDIVFSGVSQFFPERLFETLEPHLEDLTRMSTEPLPKMEVMLDDIKEKINQIFR